MGKDNYLKVKVVSPKKLIFSGSALSVSSINSAGKFDILPGHIDFITLTSNAPVVINTISGQKFILNLPISIIYTKDNKVDIYTDVVRAVK